MEYRFTSPFTGKQVGNVIKTLRELRRMTQQQLGAEVGLDQKRVTQIENGNWGVMFETLSRIAETLGYTMTIEFKKK